MVLVSEKIKDLKILVSVLAKDNVLAKDVTTDILAAIKAQPEVCAVVMTIIQGFDKPNLKRRLNLSLARQQDINLTPDCQGNRVGYQGQEIGEIKILFKSPLPGELQARLTLESIIERYLEFLQKGHQMIVLDESDRHVQIFTPGENSFDFSALWEQFINQVVFSIYGSNALKLPGLAQTFIAMLNSVMLSGRGFSILDIPILNQEQATVLGAWYFGVWRHAKKRQEERQQKIDSYLMELEQPNLTEKERKSKTKQLSDAQAMQVKEAKKYCENFQKFWGGLLQTHIDTYDELAIVRSQLEQSNLSKSEQKKLEKQQDKLRDSLVFSQDFIQQKQQLFEQTGGDPFLFVKSDQELNPEDFKGFVSLAKNFTKTATDQINGTRGDIFAQCIIEMYCLMKRAKFDQPPSALLTEQPSLSLVRSAGDDSKEFCYACGTKIDPKTARWQVLRLIFERPAQRRQSASGEGQPHICASCSVLAFASPLKLTNESIVLRLEPRSTDISASLKLKDYLRMLANKELHLNSGKYIVLASEKTQGGESASQKLGQIQYALAKVAAIFPLEVLSDFQISLMLQGSQAKFLESRHLIFIKGLMECYGQPIIASGKEVNTDLGEAIRYIERDLPYFAEYTLIKLANIMQTIPMEQVRRIYWEELCKQGVSMTVRANLYRDVAALTGLTWAIAGSLENTAKKLIPADVEREVSKLIEKVDDAVTFCYFATLGDNEKSKVQGRLWKGNDSSFIYEQTKTLLEELGLKDREKREEEGKDHVGKTYLTIHADDILRAYTHFASQEEYQQEKDWKELTYQLKLSLYTRFPELVRKIKITGDK
jgi:hypothetical protein